MVVPLCLLMLFMQHAEVLYELAVMVCSRKHLLCLLLLCLLQDRSSMLAFMLAFVFASMFVSTSGQPAMLLLGSQPTCSQPRHLALSMSCKRD